MTILRVQITDPKAAEGCGDILLCEYIDIPPSTDPADIIQVALAQAYLTYGIKLGKRPERLQVRKDDIVSMYVDTLMSTEQIAHALGGSMSDGTVARFLRANGVVLRKPGKRTLQASPEIQATVASLYVAKRMTLEQIAAEVGLSVHHVRKILREKNVTMRLGRPARQI